MERVASQVRVETGRDPRPVTFRLDWQPTQTDYLRLVTNGLNLDNFSREAVNRSACAQAWRGLDNGQSTGSQFRLADCPVAMRAELLG